MCVRHSPLISHLRAAASYEPLYDFGSGYAVGDVRLAGAPPLMRMRSCCKVGRSHDLWSAQIFAACNINPEEKVYLQGMQGSMTQHMKAHGCILGAQMQGVRREEMTDQGTCFYS